MPAVARFLYITIDAQDAERIADFWAAVLDTERDEELDEGRFLVLKGGDDLPALCVQRVPEPKQGKVRIHLDRGATDPTCCSPSTTASRTGPTSIRSSR